MSIPKKLKPGKPIPSKLKPRKPIPSKFISLVAILLGSFAAIMAILVFESLLTVLVFLLAYFYLQYRRTYSFWSSRGITGPRPLPIFGNSLSYILGNYVNVDEANFKKFGKTYGIYEGTRPVLVTSDSSLIQDVWITKFSTFSRSLDIVSPDPLDNNVITNVTGEDWKRVRNVFTNSFSTSRIKEATSGSDTSLNKFFSYLELLVREDRPINAREIFACLTLDITTGAFYSLNTDVYKPKNSFLENAKNVLKFEALDLFLLENLPIWACRALGLGLVSGTASAYFKKIVTDLIKNRSNGGEYRKDLLQLFIDAQDEDAATKNKGMKEIEVMANGVVLLGGAFDAMTTSLSFLAWQLAQNPATQEKVHEEVVGVMGHVLGKPVSYDDTKQMPYLEAAINESFRVNNVIFRNFRVASEDTTLTETGIQLPKGTAVHIPIYVLHYDRETFPDPHLFQPERFLGDAEKKIVNGTFVPFGLGPRQCVAMRFALASMKQCLAEVIRRYEIIPAHEGYQELKFPKGTMMASETLVEVKFVKRSD